MTTARDRLRARYTTLSDTDEAALEADLDAFEAEALRHTGIPLVVTRFDTAMEPAVEEEPNLTIGCITQDGQPVALLLDPETRAKVAGWLAPNGGNSVSSSIWLLMQGEYHEGGTVLGVFSHREAARGAFIAAAHHLPFGIDGAEEDEDGGIHLHSGCDWLTLTPHTVADTESIEAGPK